MQSLKSNALEPTRAELATLSRGQAIVRVLPVYGLPLLTILLIGLFSLLLPEGTDFTGSGLFADVAVAPDGRRIAFSAGNGSASRVFVRDLSSPTSTTVGPGERPFFSPDGRTIGFYTKGDGRRGAAGDLPSRRRRPRGLDVVRDHLLRRAQRQPDTRDSEVSGSRRRDE